MEQYHGFDRLDFLFEDREAILIFPKKAEEKRRFLLKTEYFDAFPAVELALLERGFHLAFLKNIHRWCAEDDLDRKHRFCAFLSEKYALAPRCIPVGMSCGGMFAVNFAAKYPADVSCLYLDAPVLNLCSCPGDMGIAKSGLFPEFHAATGVTRSALIVSRDHPIDKLPVLAAHRLPVALVYGKEDTTVPYCENGAVLERFYRENGLPLLTVGKEHCGHHPHGPKDPAPVVSFIENNG